MSGRITCEVSRQWPAPDQHRIIPQQQNFMTELTHSHKELSSFTANPICEVQISFCVLALIF